MESDGAVELRDLPRAAWLGLPAASVAMCWLTPLLGYPRWHALLVKKETGFIENATVAFLVPAIVVAVLVFLRRRQLPRFVGAVMLLGGLGALYFAGEETSWGQHWLGYETPGCIAKINRQGEFNLHNIELIQYGPVVDLVDDLFGNIPRQMMLAGCVVGGLVLPFVLKKRLSRPPSRESFWYWVIPTRALAPAALIAVLSTVPEKFYKLAIRGHVTLPRDSYIHMALIAPGGEFKEYCYALVICLYLLSVYVRLRQWRRQAAGDAPG